MTQSPLDAALDYAARGWPVFPVRSSADPNAKKYPHTAHGMNDASHDKDVIKEWWARWSNAVPAILTGEPSGIVALDIDIRANGSGFDTLEELGLFWDSITPTALHPIAPTAHTPRGGCAVLFQWPGHFVKTSVGELGPHLDIRGDRGSVILPPGPGRFWDPHLGPDTPIPDMPGWMGVTRSEPSERPKETVHRPSRPQPLYPYGEATLDRALNAILNAPAGQQRDTINREAYSVGQLVASGEIPAGLAVEALLGTVPRLPSYDTCRPWRLADLEKIIRNALADGLARPRRRERAR